jgi:hypothetical protein
MLVLGTEIPDMLIIGVGQLTLKRLVQSADDNQQRLRPVFRGVVETAEQSVMVTPGSVDTDLEPSRHRALHCFPVTTTRESLRRCGRNLRQNRAHGRPHLDWAGIQKLLPKYSLARVVFTMSAKVSNVVRVIRRWPGANRRCGTSAWRGLLMAPSLVRAHSSKMIEAMDSQYHDRHAISRGDEGSTTVTASKRIRRSAPLAAVTPRLPKLIFSE